MKKKILFIGLAFALALTGCGNQAKDNTKTETKEEVKTEAKAEKKDESKVIYASFYPIYNLTKQIAGDKFEVKAFNSLTTESHDFEPSAKEIAELGESQLIFMNGAGMEEWKDDVEKTVGITMVDTSEGLDLIKADHEDADHDHDHEDADHDHDHEDADHDHDHEEGEEHHHHHHGQFDPHTWLSPVNAKAQAKVIADKLSEIDPANKDYYEGNYEKIAKEFDEIISEYKEKFEKVSNKKFIVPHQAFGYVARDFGLEQIPLASLTSTADPDAKVMKEVTDLAKADKIKTVFFEKGGSDKAAKTIADEIGAEVAPLSTMEFATQEEIDKEVTIQEIIKENLENIYKSLA
ncbi:metal ABC transporter solute-binding protein, Zn/Mn family [uncultured Anaerococcus sp.]|uniref:metal ABC transporter solute-binding protein, Zn/Mn family n=1 Tax=uncultured Anaerococcus sp. TaxID=293428 RepID=UPI00288A631C|nr:zinc ABC transporter substrate-binding protein [uncultured Anaerococcus sp.]